MPKFKAGDWVEIKAVDNDRLSRWVGQHGEIGLVRTRTVNGQSYHYHLVGTFIPFHFSFGDHEVKRYHKPKHVQ